MSLSTFGVDKACVLKYLASWSGSGATLPGATDITGEWLNAAAAKINGALVEVGIDPSLIDSTNHPAAYYQCRHITAFTTAYLYMRSLNVQGNTDWSEQAREEIDSWIKQIKTGRQLGEVSASEDSPARLSYHHGDTSDDDLSEERITWDDEL